MKERSLRIVDLEAKAKKTRVIHNILSGSSTNPGIDTIKSLERKYKVFQVFRRFARQ